jgi:hypothetical protein
MDADDVVVAGQLDCEFLWSGELAHQRIKRVLIGLHYPGQSGAAVNSS